MVKTVVMFLFLGLLLVGSASAYICIDPSQDNNEVVEFKQKINELSIKEDIDNGITMEALSTKLKYFGPCR